MSLGWEKTEGNGHGRRRLRSAGTAVVLAVVMLTPAAPMAHAATGGQPSYSADERARAEHGRDDGEPDGTAPGAPGVTIAAPYSECLANDCQAAGGPGVDVTFTLSPNEADTDVVSYDYRLSSESVWRTVSGATVTVTLTPQLSGLHFLDVRARDDVGRGRLGATTRVSFKVAEGHGESGRWRFAEAEGAALDSGTSQGDRHDVVLSGGATRDERGRRGLITHDPQGVALPDPVTDRGLLLDGTAGYAATEGPVVGAGASYTLSAWVRPESLGSTDQVVLAQGGSGGLRLLYDGARGTWALRNDTEGGPGQVTVAAGLPAVAGVWTHLAAMYDAAAGQVRLYVNGRLQAQESAVALVAEDGPLEFGRAASATASTGYAGYFAGSLDEVAIWQRPLTDTEIGDEARVVVNAGHNAVELVADWSATGQSGATLADTASGYAPELLLSGSAALDGRAIVLDGVDGAATADGPLVDDTGSFTVSAEVTLDAAAISTKPVGFVGQVLGWRSADGSVWGLWYQVTGTRTVLDPDTFEEVAVPVGAWRFGRRNADGSQTAVTSDEPARLDGPVRLTGVHDAQDAMIELYVGSARNGGAVPFTATPGSGDFTVGAVPEAGSWTDRLPARVTGVRVWAGAMASPQQIAVVVGG